MKKTLLLLLSLIMLLQTPLALAAEYKIYPLGDGRVEIAGHKDENQPITVLIVLSDGDISLKNVGQIPMGSGEFSRKFFIASPDNIAYTAKIKDSTSTKEITVKNVTALGAVNELKASSDAHSMADNLETYNRIFNLNFDNLDKLCDSSAVYDVLLDEKASLTIHNLQTKFDTAVDEAVNVEIQTALDYVESSSAAEAINKYYKHFDIEKLLYDGLSNKTAVLNALNGKSYTKAEFESAFNDATYTSNVNESNNSGFKQALSSCSVAAGIAELLPLPESVYAKLDALRFDNLKHIGDTIKEENALYILNNATAENVETTLNNYDNILKIISTSTDYTNLNSYQKTLVFSKFAEKDYQNLASAKDSFNLIVKDVKNLTSQTDNNKEDNKTGPSYSMAGGISSSPTPIAPQNPLPFGDVPSSHWGYKSILSLYRQGIVSGTTENTFEPERNITREEFIKMLVNTFDLYDEKAENIFTDVASGDWSEKYIASAHKVGLVKGRGDGTFGKGEFLSREDMAVMAVRCADIAKLSFSEDVETEFADETEFSNYALESIYTLSKAGIINGVGDDIFSPRTSSNRAMAAKICDALLELSKGGAK